MAKENISMYGVKETHKFCPDLLNGLVDHLKLRFI